MTTTFQNTKPIRREIDKNFIIRYRYDTEPKTTYLIKSFGYINLVGEKLALSHFEKVLDSKEQVTTLKLRRGLKIEFISK